MIYSPQNISNIPQATGVYQFLDISGKIIYIGKARNLKNRISSYFRNPNTLDDKTRKLVPQIRQIKLIIVDYEFEALIIEANLIRKLKPKYNIIWKDDRHYIYMEISKEEFPRLTLSRKKESNKSEVYGPFPSSQIAQELLYDIRHIFPYCTQNRNQKKECFYTHIGLCGPCPANIKKEKGGIFKLQKKEYLGNISKIRELLKGNIKPIKNYLEIKMNYHSRKLEYEKAKLYRNRIIHLDYLSGKYQRSADITSDISGLTANRTREMRELADLLKPYFPNIKNLSSIECYDISNISGTLTVGSLVSFINGIRNPKNYRKFRIRKEYSDDFHALYELMDRRLDHKNWSYPDLIVIDGGKPQLKTIEKVFITRSVSIPFIGIAKKNEELVVLYKGKSIKLKLPRSSDALHLIQRLRDEAHRFAHKYHLTLRNKNVFNL